MAGWSLAAQVPAIFGETLSPQEKGLFALPIREGGLGIEELSIKAPREYEISKKVTQPLVTAMVIQSNTLPDKEEQQSLINEAKLEKQQELQERSKRIEDALPVATKQVVQQTKMVGASNWLNAIPLAEHGFNLSKGEFRDALALRFNHDIKGLPSKCPCGQRFDVTHAMNCKRGGFVIMRHNDIRDFEANLLKRVCNDVEIEPPLQPLTNEHLERGAINTDSARLDVRARGFWRRGQNAFIDVRVTNPGAATQSQKSIEKILQKHEREKKRAYNERIMNVEHGTFTPLVFTVLGGMGQENEKYHKHLADKIATKSEDDYSKVVNYIRCKVAFIVLRSALLCLRGSRTIRKEKIVAVAEDIDLGHDELLL